MKTRYLDMNWRQFLVLNSYKGSTMMHCSATMREQPQPVSQPQLLLMPGLGALEH